MLTTVPNKMHTITIFYEPYKYRVIIKSKNSRNVSFLIEST